MAAKSKPDYEKLILVMEKAREFGLVKFKCSEFEFELGELKPQVISVEDNPLNREIDFKQAAEQAKVRELDEMALTNPVEYENIMEQMISERKNAEEVIVQ